ncbi:hypothetical protein BDD12DRAFT_886153 [Trichophaea hybrida]|nr:hypothetical protein BDD12DRAFT_886153 [Trichophaea hybrida]
MSSSPDKNPETPQQLMFPAPQLGPFPPKPNNHIYIPTKDGWISSLSMSPVRRIPPQTPNSTEEGIRQAASRDGSVREDYIKSDGTHCCIQ